MKKFTFILFCCLVVSVNAFAFTLSDPGADRIAFWDESSNDYVWLELDSSVFTFNDTTLELDSNLSDIAALTTTTYGRGLLEMANKAALQSDLSIDDIQTLTGISEGTAHLGTFSGTTITDSSTIKTALQELETAVEAGGGGSGDVESVGDCASGACLDGTSDGGTYISLYDGDSNKGTIQIPNVATDLTYTMPSGSGVLLLEDGTGENLTAVDAITGDSATAFFSAGTIEHEYGGLEADVSAYSGLVGISGGATAEVNTSAELETYAGLGAFANEYLDDANAAAMLVTLGLTATASEINTPLDGASVTLTEFQELETIGATTISANQWAAIGGMPETLTSTELGYSDGVTSAIQTQLDAKLENVVEDTTPQLGGDLDVNDNEITNSGTGSVVVELGDDAGSDVFEIEDSGDVTVFDVDSDGNVTISGTINESATAKVKFLDIDAPGTDKDVGNIEVAYVDGADGLENADMYFRITQDGAENTVILQFDESDDQWETSKDIDSSAAIKAESIDAGVVWTLHGDGGTPYDLSASTICHHLYYMSSSATADVEVDLHSDPRCLGTDNTGRELEFFNFNTTYDYDIDPNGTDTIYLDGVSCGAGKQLMLEAIGEYARIVGYSAGVWVVTNHNGASCEP